MAAYLGDGYDLRAELEGVQFEYRPLPLDARMHVVKRMAGRTAGDARDIMDAVVRDRLIVEPFQQLPNVDLKALFLKVIGYGTHQQERSDEHNLRTGIRLMIASPQLAQISCGTCRKYVFDPVRVEFATDVVTGERLLREKGFPPPVCEFSNRCLVGHHASQRRLSPKNLKCLTHYLECKATCQFPDDPYVRKNARIIKWAVERAKQDVWRPRSTNSLKRS